MTDSHAITVTPGHCHIDVLRLSRCEHVAQSPTYLSAIDKYELLHISSFSLISTNHHFNNATMGNSNSKSHTCPIPSSAQPLSIHGTAHKPLSLIAAACAILTLVSALALATLHLTRYRAPKEQRQIIRILFAPFIFAVVAWGGIADYDIAAYIDPIGDVYESFCLCALFLLYIQFAAPRTTFGEEMFKAMEHAATVTDAKGGAWARLSWIYVFQFPLTELLSVIVLEATVATGSYCESSLSPRFGHVWVMIISTLGVVLAMMSIFRFYKRTKPVMKARRGLAKLVCFKGIVFLRFIQTVRLAALLSSIKR